mgnify:CR=1 FL=1
MRLRTATLGAAWTAFLLAGPVAVAQPPVKPQTSVERFRAARDLILEGRFDLAGEQLRDFLAGNPTDKDLLDLEAKFGVTVFEKLKLVPRWSEDPKANAEYVKIVDDILAKDREARRKLYRDPARIAKFVRNLGETTEERIYAEQQLYPSGDAVVATTVDILRGSNDLTLRAGVLGAVRRLGPEIVPGFLASLEGLPDDVKGSLLTAIVNRTDALALTNSAESDPRPWLWYYASSDSPAVKAETSALLRGLIGPIEKRPADVELYNLAKPFAEKKAEFKSLDAVANKVTVWTWDAAKLNVFPTVTTKPQAEEFYGYRYLRWALERNPGNVPAQELFLTFASERAVERSKFGVLSKSEPAAYQLLAASPSPMLIRLLDQAMKDQNTPLAFALAQGLADRAEKAAVNPTVVELPDGKKVEKPAVLVRALDYPEPRVQLVAAIGLLRIPGPPLHGKQARVVDILKRAAGAEPPAAGTSNTGRALVVDPSDMRADRVGKYLADLGFATERFTSGRDVIRRIHKASDFDLVVLDRHIANPELGDILAQLSDDANLARRPVLVVASTDKAVPVPLDQMLLRLAGLVAVTETDEPAVTPPFSIDPRKPLPDDLQKETRRIAAARDKEFEGIFLSRLARLKRLVAAANLPADKNLQARLDLRLPQFTWAAIMAEYLVTPESAPETVRRFEAINTVVLSRPELTGMSDKVNTDGVVRLIEQIQTNMDAERFARLDAMRKRIPPATLGLPPNSGRDLLLEDRLARLVGKRKGMTVIPEPYSLVGFEDDVKAAVQDPGAMPRDPAEKRLAAKYAVEWLRRIALNEVPGYDVRPAEPALKTALREDELAEPAIDALSRIPTADAQQDLLNVALAGTRPAEIRFRAADRAQLHIQAFGKLIPATQAAAIAPAAEMEKVGDLKGKLLVLQQLLVGTPNEIVGLIPKYPNPLTPPAAPMPEPKKD